MIKFRCDDCGKHCNAPDELAGELAECGLCGNVLCVPNKIAGSKGLTLNQILLIALILIAVISPWVWIGMHSAQDNRPNQPVEVIEGIPSADQWHGTPLWQPRRR